MIIYVINLLLLSLVLIQRPYFDKYADENYKELRTVIYMAVIALCFIDLFI